MTTKRRSAAIGGAAALFGLVAAAEAAAPASSGGMLSVGAHRDAFLMQQAIRGFGPDQKLDYNNETDIPGLPLSVEFLVATVWVLLIASVPAVLVGLVGGKKLTLAHKIESGVMLLWLVVVLFLFTNVLKFNSSHWTGSRPLTLVESVYLLSQILTTVGYGDITPAFPRGQVWVAINVIFALCLYGSLVMEVVDLSTDRIRKAIAKRRGLLEDAGEGMATDRYAAEPLKAWGQAQAPISYSNIVNSAIAFFISATIGVLFWHLYPGEGKTVLQAVYMSIITLSTVGFGWFNATTEGGKVFGAFWMLFGVASLAAVIGNFVDIMMQIKERERHDENVDKLTFFRYIRECTTHVPSLGDNGMDSYQFFKFGVLLKKIATEEELQAIEERFAELAGTDNKVDCTKLQQEEGPPAELLPKKAPPAEDADAQA